MPEPGTGLTPELVLDAASEGICVLDRDGRVIFANPAAAALLDRPVERLIGERLHDLCHHHRADGSQFPYDECPVRHVLADGRPRRITGDVMWRSPDTMLTVDSRITPVVSGGEVTGAVVVFTDAVLPRAGSSAGQAIDVGVVGTAVVSLDGRYLQVSPRACTLLGRSEEELRTCRVQDIAHPDDVADILSAMQRMRDGQIPYHTAERRYLRPDGDTVYALLHASLVRSANGDPAYFFSQLVDVTEDRRADELLRRDARRTAQVVELCDLLAESTTDERELLQDVAGMVARIVCDAATVWVVEDGALRAVSAWHPDPEAAEALKKIYDSTSDASQLARMVVESGEAVFIPDLDPDRLGSRWRGVYGEWLERVGVRSLILVPMRVRRRTVGVLVTARDGHSEPYGADDLALVKDIGQRVALAIDNARLFSIARDAQRAVEASEARHRALVQHSADVIMILDPDGQIEYATPSTRAVFGRDPSEFKGCLMEHVHPDDQPSVRSVFQAILSGDRPGDFEFRVRHADGGWRYVEGSGTDLVAEPAVGGIVVNLRDITERRRVAEQQAAVAALGQWALSGTALPDLLDAAAALVTRTLELPLCGVFELLPGAEALRLVAGVGWSDGVVGSATVPTGVRGVAEYELAWTSPVTAGDLDGAAKFLGASLLLQHGAHSGISVAVEGHASPYGVMTAFSTSPRRFSQADINFLVAVANVVAAVVERRRAEDEVRHQALHDGLTGLPNRTLLADRLQQALAAASRDGTQVGLLLLDLDGFKDVNDSLGHHAGDQLLRQVAERLCCGLRASDTVARLGGDEFAVCLPDLHSPAEASAIASKLLGALESPFELAEMSVSLSASIGVAFSGDHGHEPSVLLQRADIAMYRAKRARCGWALYDTATDEAHRHRLAVLAELRDAAALGELELHYQPLLDLRTREVERVEALVRWVHPVRGMIAPGEFIPLAEQSGLIHPLTAWVLQSAVDQAARWAGDGLDLRIAVNLSAAVLQDESLPSAITTALADAGLTFDHLVVEITESVIAEEGVREALQRLADAGITCAVDDFGTGYSSLAWLKNLPVHQLKIDRAFVTDMAHDPRDRAIVESVIQLAHSLGLQVIAEGIESEEVAGLVTELGADFAQGFLFCRPMPGAELERWLAAARPRVVSGTIVA